MDTEMPAYFSQGIEVGSTWSIYFPDEDFSETDRKVKLIGSFIEYINSQQGDHLLSQVRHENGICSLPVDFMQLQKNCMIKEFYAALEMVPKEALLCMGAAVHEVLLCSDKQSEYHRKTNVRLYNHPDSMLALKNLKAAFIGRLVSVRGTVVRISIVKPLVVQMNFSCVKCGSTITRRFPDGKYSPPTSCIFHSCKSKTFIPIRFTAQTFDFQKIRIQELLQAENHEEGRMPRTVECELTEDLVDACIPGDVVTVCGIVKVINTDMDVGGGKPKSKNLGLFYLYLEAVSLVNSKSQSVSEELQDNSSNARAASLLNSQAFSSRDLEFIVKFAQEHGSDIFRQILHSVCPSIYGHELVKGAMVLADRGVCCIDEFDKMSAEHQALLEAMEQQSVSVAKAGLVASLSARTSVLAAANPVGGHYNRAKTVNENLKMSAALLSRFDLVFILLDKPDELLDKRVSEHIMALHSGSEDRYSSTKQSLFQINQSEEEGNASSGSLASRLKLNPVKDRDFVPLPGPLLRKYIAYAKQFVIPRMSTAAADVLQQFYLKLRNHSSGADGTPITARQLESLVRLVEARARLDLREVITKQDAVDVVEIMKESLYDKFVDEHGCVDFARSGGMSQQKEAKRFLSALQRQSEVQQKACFAISELYLLADEISLNVPDVDTLIENMNTAGYLLKKGHKTYQVLSSSFSGTQRSSQARSRC